MNMDYANETDKHKTQAMEPKLLTDAETIEQLRVGYHQAIQEAQKVNARFEVMRAERDYWRNAASHGPTEAAPAVSQAPARAYHKDLRALMWMTAAVVMSAIIVVVALVHYIGRITS